MDLEALVSDATARIAAAPDSAALEAVRIDVLGRKAPLVLALRELGSLPPDERRARGAELNRARVALEQHLERRAAELGEAELEHRLRTDRVDITLPGERRPRGHAHLIEQTRRDILDVFVGFGYGIAEGPEVDTVYYNFDALNHARTHPSRQLTDTFYVADDVVLRTHTSPVQIRTMEAMPPPVYMATAGRCYRRDTPDATHTAMFTQLEGLVVDRGITLAHLKGTLLH
ncbi:MAG TPA: phenylalanine--tRNA ligase subunit alpha, partial [Gaiellales bacterium]